MATSGIRVIFSSDTAGHTAGYHVVARALRDAGFEVVMTGSTLPREAVEIAAQEDAALLAFRIMDRDPIELATALFAEQEARHCQDIPILLGGIIGRSDAEKLRAMGVAGVFSPGAKLSDITECARQACRVLDSRPAADNASA